MPKVSHKIKLGILLFIFAGVFFIFQDSFSYDDKTTHPGLTDEIVDFYNLSFGDKLTDEEKEWIVQGAIDEDTPPRWINHFYDPIYKTGWSGEKTGIWPTLLIQYFASGVLSSENPTNSLDWLHNQELQSKYGAYKGNRTWERAIYEAVKNGDKKEAYYTLGFILHLIEDASVPDHTRNDTHAHELRYATLDYGSPYEEFAKQYTRQNLQIAQELKKENAQPIARAAIDEYLVSLAEYSNKYFFSKDTINDSKYQYPKIIRTDENFGYGKDDSSIEFPLVNVVIIRTFENDEYKKIYNYYLPKKDNNSTVLKNYFSRLSRQAVLNGAGIINLFKQEVAKAEKEKLQSIPKESSAIWSLTGRVYQIQKFISTGVNLLSSPIKNFKENLSANVLSTLVNTNADIQNNNQNLAAMSVSAFQGAVSQPSGSNSTSAAESSVVLSSEETQEQPALISNPPAQTEPSSVDKVAGNIVPSPVEIVALPEQKQTEIAPEPVVPASESLPAPEPSVSATEPVAPLSVEPTVPASNPTLAPTYSYVSYSSPAPPEPASPPPAPLEPESPPPAPTITLNSGLDFATSTALLTLTGEKSEKADDIFVNDSAEGVVYPSTTTWSKEITLAEGLNVFSVKAKNLAGESSEVAINITFDSIPPGAPQITSHSNNQILNTSTIILTGTAEASSTILITQNSNSLEEANADENGDWQKSVTLAAAANNFQIIAKDAVGNQSPAAELVLYFSDYHLRDVVINEIAWAGTRASDDDEWIELYNPTASEINLDGWSLAAAGGTPNIVLAGKISAFSFYLLERTNDETVADIEADLIYTGALSNSGEHLKLLDPNVVPIDEVNASAGWFAGQNQKVGNVWQRISMERINPNQSGSDFSNWGSNNQEKIHGEDVEGNDILGTPKKANSLYVPVLPTAIGDLAIASSTNNSVTLSWSAPSDADALNSELIYDIRYSKKDLSEDSEWDKAEQAEDEPAALEDGQAQTFTISELESDKTYYFAVKTFDSENNYSAISNIVNFQTPEEEEEETEVVYEQNFESLNDAPLCNQDGWAGWCHWTVLVPYQDEWPAYDGDKAVRNNSGGTHVSKTFAETPKALISIAVKLHHSPTIQLNLKSGDALLGYVNFNVYGGLQVVGKNSQKAADFSEDVWHLAKIETDSDKKRFRAKLGDGPWSDWEKFFDDAEGDLNKIEIYYWKPNYFTDYGYFDAVSISQVSD